MSKKGYKQTKEHIAKRIHRKLSEKTKEKMRLAHLGKKYKPMSKRARENISESHKGKHFPNQGFQKGHLMSKKTRKKIRDRIRKLVKQGKWHSWKGGRTELQSLLRQCYEYRQWRSDVFTRDDFTCQFCRQRGCRLEADHYPKKFTDILDEYNVKTFEEALACEELWNINNGRTLCKKCHSGTSTFGRRKREDIEKIIN